MVVETVKHALMITSFVFIMMLIIEYVNVLTRGHWQESLKKYPWMQYFLAAFLGATPGCLGAFTVVALYTHDIVSFGALVTVMIATSGDEAFVMLSLFPGTAILLTVILLAIALVAGFVTDLLFTPGMIPLENRDRGFAFHDEDCVCFPRDEILSQLKNLTLQRGVLLFSLILFVSALLSRQLGPHAWNWIKVTLLGGSLVALFITATVPEHFLEEHLWEHIVKVHIPRVFLWTLGALVVMAVLLHSLDLGSWIEANYLTVLLIACLVGFIPESGPHMIFVTLFAEGAIPFGILLASSVVQDGHGMLPLLAESKKGFISVKVINLSTGLLVGLAWYVGEIYL